MIKHRKLSRQATRHHNSIAEKKRKWIKLAIQQDGFSYDTAGRLNLQTMPNADTVGYTLDENGNRTRLTWPDNYYADYGYDELNRLKTITLNGAGTAAVSLDYDGLSRRRSITYPLTNPTTPVTTTLEYALNNDLTSLDHVFVGSSVSFNYSHNKVHQLQNVSVNDSSYLWMPTASSTVSYGTANDLNQYPSVGGTSFSYNNSGCTTAGPLCAANFDMLNRLTQAISGSSNINNYLIDPLDRQAQKQVNNASPAVANVTVGSDPAAVAITPDGTKAYVCNSSAGTISVINTSTNTVSATVTVGTGPSALAITPDGSKVYVLNNGAGTVSVINTSTNTVVATVTVGSSPAGLAITPDGSKVYVTNHASNNVSVINTASQTVSATITVGTAPGGIAITPDGSKAYVTNSGAGTVSVINTSSNTVSATVTVGSSPGFVVITPDGTKAYVANAGAASVSVINTSSNTVSATVTVGNDPYAMAVTPDGTKVYVVNLTDGTVSVISTATNTVIATITVGTTPSAIATSPDGAHAFVANAGSATVSAVNTCTNAVYTTISVGNSPLALAVTPNRQEAFVCNETSGTVSVISIFVNTDFLYDGNQLIATLNDSTGAIVNRYIPGVSLDEIFLYINGSTSTYLHRDRQNTVIAETNSSGAVANKFTYSPFGETTSISASGFGYTGQLYDSEVGLYNYKARYYAPSIGRFLQPDPIGYAAGDMNLYGYCGNDGGNLTDPLGLFGGLMYGAKYDTATASGPLQGHVQDYSPIDWDLFAHDNPPKDMNTGSDGTCSGGGETPTPTIPPPSSIPDWMNPMNWLFPTQAAYGADPKYLHVAAFNPKGKRIYPNMIHEVDPTVNCGGFAFGVREVIKGSTGAIDARLKKEHYYAVPVGARIRSGDRVVYRRNGKTEHIGIVVQIDSNGNATYVNSKLGQGPYMGHQPLDTYLTGFPAFYGNDITFYRK